MQQLEVGAIIEGKVTGITKFGAFVELPGGKTGMVHISEVSTAYVKEISDHLSENQMVKVKVLRVGDDGKVSLSIKKCMDPAQQQATASAPPHQQQRPPRRQGQPRGAVVWTERKRQDTSNMSFEDMLSKFKQTSEDKMSDLKRAGGDTRRPKRGGGGGGGGGGR